MRDRSLANWRRGLLWTIALLALGTLVRSNVHWLQLVATRVDHCPQPGCDFVRHYLPQARQLFSHPGVVVPGWLYPPSLALLLQPFALASDEAALQMWMVLQLLLAGCLAWQCRCALRSAGRWTSWAGGIGLVVLSLPVAHAVKWGQVSLLVGVMAIWALQRRTRLAATILGGLAALKLYLVFYGASAMASSIDARTRPSANPERVPLGQRSAAISRRAFAAWLAGSALILGLILPLVLLGPRSTSAFGRRLVDAARVVRPERLAYLGGQSLDLTLRRWFVNGAHEGREFEGPTPRVLALGNTAWWARGPFPSWLLFGPTLAVGLVSWHRMRTGPPEHRVSVLLLAVGLAVQPGWHHYFVFLPFALATALASVRPAVLALGFAGFLASALPLLLLADVPGIYFLTSAWGATTCAACATWLALVLQGSVAKNSLRP